MQRTQQFGWILALMILPEGFASAQRPELAPSRMGLIVRLTMPGVQQELKLDEVQKKKAEVVMNDLKAKMAAQRAEILAVPQPERFKKSAEMAQPIVEAACKEVDGFLKPEQLKRLTQIEFQFQGFQALNDPEVKAKLKLTPQQEDEINQLRTEMVKTTTALARDRRDDPATAMKKAGMARQAVIDKIPSVLDENQKKVWKELAGEPIDLMSLGKPGA